MSRLTVVPIVEGHGEFACSRKLLERIWYEIVQGEFIDVLQPIRQPKDKLIKDGGTFEKAIDLAVGKLNNSNVPDARALILVLVDANGDPPCKLGPKLLHDGQMHRADKDITCVVANVEYETWFVAAAESLSEFLNLSSADEIPPNPEESRHGKGWIKKHYKGSKYSETLDQPRLTSKMDLLVARQRSPSFDKLCRELEKRKQHSGE